LPVVRSPQSALNKLEQASAGSWRGAVIAIPAPGEPGWGSWECTAQDRRAKAGV